MPSVRTVRDRTRALALMPYVSEGDYTINNDSSLRLGGHWSDSQARVQRPAI